MGEGGGGRRERGRERKERGRAERWIKERVGTADEGLVFQVCFREIVCFSCSDLTEWLFIYLAVGLCFDVML